LAANQKLIKQVEDLEHKARRQDVLVDDELIYAFYDQQLPADVCSGHSFERWYREESKKPQYNEGGWVVERSAQVKGGGQRPGDTEQSALPPSRPAPGERRESTLLRLTREELMRHEAAGITTASFPKTIRLGGVDCAATYLHEPGDARDGLTVTVPLFVLNQVNDERCEWMVPGMLKEKVQALIKTLHQRPRSRLVPLPDTATKFAEALNAPEKFGAGSLVDAVLKLVRDVTALDIVRADIKVDMLTPHYFMNFRVVDEHGRQMGHGRNLAALKAELGSQARGAFQALASLKLAQSQMVNAESSEPPGGGAAERIAQVKGGGRRPGDTEQNALPHRVPAPANTARDATKNVAPANTAKTTAPSILDGRFTAWTFGELPELLEIKKGGQTLIGFPALIDAGDAVTVEVFDEPEVAAAKHRAGLRRLCALQIKDALKYLEKNIPELQKMAVSYMNVGKADNNTGGGTIEELREQIIAVALDRAFLLDPLPTDEFAFKRRIEEGRGRLTLIANEVARMASVILLEYAAAARKIKDTKNAPDAVADAALQLQRLIPKKFLQTTPWDRLQHLARYLKAITLRLDKYRADPARDAARMTELRPQEQRYWRLVAERKGVVDERMAEFRWLLEELRVSFFAQELRTPQPVSVKRLDKAWAQVG
jgi:ATP-dependent helicase HrpA